MTQQAQQPTPREERLFVIREGLANAVLQYLGQRPFVEVSALINGLTALQLVNVAPPPTDIVPEVESVAPTEEPVEFPETVEEAEAVSA